MSDKATIIALSLACLLAGLVLAGDAVTSGCRESVGYGRCDIGATVSLEMGDRVVCRCPSPGGTVTIAAPRHGGTP